LSSVGIHESVSLSPAYAYSNLWTCDFRIAARSATLGSHEVNINQPMTNGSTYLLPRLIGEGRAKLLGMSGEIIDVAQAERIGLVSSVVEDRGLTAAVEELVAKLVSVGPIAVACVKECFARSRDVDIEAAVIFENEAATKCFVSESLSPVRLFG